MHRCASCQLSNSGTKAWREVASHYGTSVKNAGSIFRASEIDSALRQGKQRCGRQRWNSISASSFILLGCTSPLLPIHCRLIGGKLSFTFVLLLSIIRSTDNTKVSGSCYRQTCSLVCPHKKLVLEIRAKPAWKRTHELTTRHRMLHLSEIVILNMQINATWIKLLSLNVNGEYKWLGSYWIGIYCSINKEFVNTSQTPSFFFTLLWLIDF